MDMELSAVGEHIGWVLVGGRTWKKVYNEPSILDPTVKIKMFVRKNNWYPLFKRHSFFTEEEKVKKDKSINGHNML